MTGHGSCVPMTGSPVVSLQLLRYPQRTPSAFLKGSGRLTRLNEHPIDFVPSVLARACILCLMPFTCSCPGHCAGRAMSFLLLLNNPQAAPHRATAV